MNTEEHFIYVWNSSASPDEAAERLGVKKASCIHRASQIRGKNPSIKMYKSMRERRPRMRDVIYNPSQDEIRRKCEEIKAANLQRLKDWKQ